MELTTELLNKYIDGELTASESAGIKRTLERSPEDFKLYSELLTLHNNLKNIRENEISLNFTSEVMARVILIRKSKEDNYFILVISSIFLILSFLIVGFIIFELSYMPDNENSFSLFNKTADIIGMVTDHLKNFKNSTGLSIVGIIFSFGILLSGYYFFERRKILEN